MRKGVEAMFITVDQLSRNDAHYSPVKSEKPLIGQAAPNFKTKPERRRLYTNKKKNRRGGYQDEPHEETVNPDLDRYI